MSFLGGIFGGRTGPSEVPKEEKIVRILVIQADDYDWEEIFKGHTLKDGTPIEVKQTGWKDIDIGPCDNWGRKRFGVTVRNLRIGKQGKAAANRAQPFDRPFTFFPDFVLIRNEVYTPADDYVHLLLGFLYAGIPSINSLSSIYSFLQRPIVQGELNSINRRLGREFPVIEQDFFACYTSAMYTLPFPAVVKVGNAHAGYGKMRIRDHHDMEDFRSVLAMQPKQHCLAEPFLKGAHDLRLQKIGNTYRAFKRTSVSGDWKTNTGCSHMEVIPVESRYRLWLDETSKLFGGLHIVTVDVLVTEDGKETILEANGTSSGLCPETEEEDNRTIRDLVLEELEKVVIVQRQEAEVKARDRQQQHEASPPPQAEASHALSE